MTRGLRRAAKVVRLALVFTLLSVAVPSRAEAQTIDDWWLSGHGAMHCVLSSNHLVCERYDRYNNWTGYVVDAWLPAWCVLVAVHSGDGNGTPARIRLIAPYGWQAGCYPGREQSYYHGWHTGTGLYEGQYLTAGYAYRKVVYVSGRDPNAPNAYGTAIEVQ